MNVVRTPLRCRRAAAASRRPLVLVPTMGALHAGHERLLERGRRLAGDGTLVATIFVNPTQFGPREDFARYPRPFARDRALCERAGVDLLFAPEREAMYLPDFSTWVEEFDLSRGLCGASRPGHFRGVCTVVLKLFAIVGPDIAVFGEKDYQQLAVIRRMARDLDLPVRIVAAPTVRERDGLAMSSRNAYLSPAERADAPLLRRGLLAAAAAARAGERSAAKLEAVVRRTVARSPLARVDYVAAVDAATLKRFPRLPPPPRGAVIAAAVFFGDTRLIDNIRLP